MHFIFMGVSGCGKSTVGKAVANICGMSFIDGDDLHPQSNIEKMSRGAPLNDQDRAPWLKAVGQCLDQALGPTGIGCSALKYSYRDIIRAQAGPVHFLHLYADQDVLAERVKNRADHFMPTTLLDSQYQTLENLRDTELGLVINIDQAFDQVVADAIRYVRSVLMGAQPRVT